MRGIKIAVFQYKVNYLKPESNLAKFERLIYNIQDFKPDLVVFPEYALTGPLYGHCHMAFEDSDMVFLKLSDMAKKYKVNLIPGSFVRKYKERMFNSTCFIDRHGKILGFYDKVKLWSGEKRFLTPGEEAGIFETDFGRIAIQICADLNLTSLSTTYQKLKPQLIINLAMWSEEDINATKKKVIKTVEHNQVEVLMRARAIESKCWSIFCNHAKKLNYRSKTGRVYSETSIGETMIISPFGEIVCKAMDNSEYCLTYDLPFSKCNWAKY